MIHLTSETYAYAPHGERVLLPTGWYESVDQDANTVYLVAFGVEYAVDIDAPAIEPPLA